MSNITADEYSLLEFISSRDKREDNSRILLEQTKKILKSLVRKGFGRIEHYSAIGDWFIPDMDAISEFVESLIRSIDRTAKSVDTAIASHKLNDMRKKLADMVDKGKRILESSNGNVDDENNRDKLSDLLEKAKDLMESTDAKTISVDVSELDKLINKVSDDMNARQSRIEQERQQSVASASYSQPSNITSGNYTPTRSNYGSYTPTQSTPRGYYSSMSCDLTSAADHCQGAVDGGGIVDLNYGNGHVYAQHNNTGGAWINNLQAGQTFTMNGSTYRVNGQSVQGAQYAPGSGDWMQTCNGNGNHLVGITKIS